MKRLLGSLFAIIALASLDVQAWAQEQSIVVASTTSTQDSGLFGYLLPIVKQKTGVEVKVLAQALARRSTRRVAATPTWCSFTPDRQRRNFSPKGSA